MSQFAKVASSKTEKIVRDEYSPACNHKRRSHGHGLDGQNTRVPFAGKMSPPVPSLAGPAVQNYADGQLKWVIDNGISPSGIPVSKGILSDDEIWQIVIYLRHLPAKGSLGEPAVYSGQENLPQYIQPGH